MKPKPLLYIKRGCPWCREATAFFSQHGIEVEIKDVNLSQQNMQRMIQVSGQAKVPTLEYGEFIVPDFDTNELLDELEQNPEIKKAFGLGSDDE